MVALANGIVVALGLYLLAGLAFAVPFLLRGIARVDPAAHGSGVGFRLIVLPGVIAMWPLLARRWLRGTPPPTERNAHRARSRLGAP